MSYLSEYKEIDGGYAAFGEDPKGEKITDTECVVLSPNFKPLDDSQVLLRVPKKNNMYSIDLRNVAPSEGLTCLFANATLDESNLWHMRLGHINFKTMNKLFCEMKGIRREFSVARTPQQNAVVKRKNRTLIEAARTMLADSKLPTTFWAEAVYTACYVQNRVLVVKPHNKTPYELFLGRKHALSFIRPFEYPITILNTLDHLGKFDGKDGNGFFVGYSTYSKAFKVFNTRTKIIEENVHITFLENKPNVAGIGPNMMFDIDTLTMSMNYQPVFAGNQTNGNAGRERAQRNKFESMFGQEKDANGNRIFTLVSAAGSTYVYLGGSIRVNSVTILNVDLPTDPLMPDLEDTTGLQDSRIFSGAYDDKFKGVEADFNNLELTTVFKPKKVIQALTDPSWIKAMQDKLLQFKLQRVWRLVDLPKGKHDIGTKWFYRNKKDERRIAVRNKARLVAQGYTQKESIDYDEVFAPIVSYGVHCVPDGWEPTFFLELQVMQRDDGIFISQDKYVADILKKFNFSSVKTASTPIETNKALLKDEEAVDVDVHLYRSMIGSLMYLTASRPDKIVNKDVQIQALVDGKKIIVTDASIRRDLQLQDTEGTACLPNDTIFEELARMGNTMASAIICLANNQKFNFSKYIFDNMGFSGIITPVFETMMVQAPKEVGEGSEVPTDTHHTPIVTQPSSFQPQKKQKSKRIQRKENEVLDLEKAKTAQAKKIDDLKKRVMKLERKKKTTTLSLKRLWKGRMNEEEMFRVNDLDGDEVILDATASEEVEQSTKVAENEVSTADPVTTAGEVVTIAEDVKVTIVSRTP
nr:ribonuclease H-like domain-containing protein [Tanacetum cinerariifolium]